MLSNRILSRLALGAVLLAAGAALPAIAHDGNGYRNNEWRQRNDDNRDHWERHHRWEHRHWRESYSPRVYERQYVVPPPVYYVPRPIYAPPPAGVTFIYRNHW